jgi:exosortase A-associated hydrolase 2
VAQVRLEARYLATPRWPLFVVEWAPASGEARGSVLVVPPFAEELNKCRRMIALAGQALAAAGWRVIVPDLGGTGDSGGELACVRVAHWLDDLQAAASAFGPVTAVLALRLGACLAGSVLAGLPSVRTLILWQPVVSGQQHLTQFLRLKVAGGALAGHGRTTVADLRAQLAAGETIEIAGYELAPGLADDIDSLRLAPLAGGVVPAVLWLEVSASDPPVPGPLAAGFVEQWSALGARVQAEACTGEPFWSTLEVGLSQPLVDLTVARLASAT